MLARFMRNHANKVPWVALVIVVASLIVIARSLPIDHGIALLEERIDELGAAGPLLFAVVYVLAALLFIPGSALTLASGAVFGLWKGTWIVSIAATTGAALAFLIGRYLARDAVTQRAARFPRFRAIDQAIAEGGPRVVALLRLSPAVPFSIGNYLFGLTGIRFLPYVVASWLFMLPGTFLYVYLGHVGRQSLGAATTGRGAGQGYTWITTVVGLVATVVVTVYVTKLARKSLANVVDDETPSAPVTVSTQIDAAASPGSLRPALFCCVAVVAVAAAVWTRGNRAKLAGIFGPPRVVMAEAYNSSDQGQDFDHRAYDVLLRRYVDSRGLVDYAGLAEERGALDQYLGSLGAADFAPLSRDAKLAWLINAYNAFTLRLILDHRPVASIKDIEGAWDRPVCKILGRELSLNQLEHEEIRAKFKEPRVHFALVCAAIGCPRLRAEPYVAKRLHEQLEDQTRWCHAGERWFVLDEAGSSLGLTRLYQWYGGDFGPRCELLGFVRRYAPQLDGALRAGKNFDLRFLDYDWQLNSKDNVTRLPASER